MGLHVVVALAKLNLVATSSHGGTTSMVTTLLWPFILKLSFGLRPLQQSYASLIHSSRLFFFQLSQIFVVNGENVRIRYGNINRDRWERAIRLVSERVAQARRWQGSESDEDSLMNLSMLAL